ncbi:DUF3040 domain-containing protein [Saccharopolyspora sp. K220]|uniref:DUF3040 domain-containing protein n=1 Tax=Saccharopolyspora soli TaxID=2926618 RepID=UPI001F580494|nr:DUF3040 domain-containing protein [Saccharopolyspora soli]MCI2417976.1 DUF3040 domain-containing protein [Saccharopolyspora soli]
MLRRYERRLLEEIERRLSAEDPDFAEKMTHVRPLVRFVAWLSIRKALGVVAAVLAVFCLLLGAGAGFLVASLLAAVLLVFADWKIQAE